LTPGKYRFTLGFEVFESADRFLGHFQKTICVFQKDDNNRVQSGPWRHHALAPVEEEM
jgi:hypothetical protein